MQAWFRRFTIWYFFDIALSEWTYISGSSSRTCNSFSMLFIHSAFLLCSFRSHILFQNFGVSFHPIVGISSCILYLLAGRSIFLCFGMSCFVWIVWPCLGIFLVFFLSSVPSDVCPRVVLFVLLVVLLLAFHLNILPFFFLFLCIVARCRRFFLSLFPV